MQELLFCVITYLRNNISEVNSLKHVYNFVKNAVTSKYLYKKYNHEFLFITGSPYSKKRY